MEAVANSVEDYLIDGLSFKLSNSASYVTSRRSCTFHPSGSNIYTSSGGTKLIKIVLTGDSWLDPSTFRIQFDLRNLEPTAGDGVTNKEVRPIGGAWTVFRRVRILAQGQVLEDIDQYNRTHEMFHMFLSSGHRVNDQAESFNFWDVLAFEKRRINSAYL